jgi:hypothetical protein
MRIRFSYRQRRQPNKEKKILPVQDENNSDYSSAADESANFTLAEPNFEAPEFSSKVCKIFKTYWPKNSPDVM